MQVYICQFRNGDGSYTWYWLCFAESICQATSKFLGDEQCNEDMREHQYDPIDVFSTDNAKELRFIKMGISSHLIYVDKE